MDSPPLSPFHAASLNGLPPRQYTAVVHAGEEGYYEATSDAHLYDLMGGPLGDLEDPGPQDRDEVLVVTAAWAVSSSDRSRVEEALTQRRMLPNSWLTPWRQGEPAIPASLWLDSAAGDDSLRYLVVRLDNHYIPRGTLRASMDAALGRFDDLTQAVENWLRDTAQELALPRSTRSWMMALHQEDDDEEFEDALGELDGW